MIIKHETVLIIFHIFIQFCAGLEIFKINSLDELKSVPKLLESGPNYATFENIDYSQNEDTNKKGINNKKYKVEDLNKILVKRIVPHGLDTGKYEYDYKFNTFYKPLVRIHKKVISNADTSEAKKAIFNMDIGINDHDDEQNDELHELEDKYDLSKSDGNEMISSNPNKIDEVWDGEMAPTFKNKENQDTPNVNGFDYLVYITKRKIPIKYKQNEEKQKELALLLDIYKLMNTIKSKSSKLKAYKKIMAVLRSVDLRAYHEKSGEDNDPLVPGHNDHVMADTGENKDRVWMPHYPPWNYWTYKKTLHQDVCPGDQVKVGNMCIWIPPH